MRGFLVTFVVVFFLTAAIFPIIEILGAFLDMLQINNAILVSSRSAFTTSLDDDLLRDVEVGFKEEDFIKDFKENFYLMMGEEKKDTNTFNIDIEAVRIEDFKDYAFELIDSDDYFDAVQIAIESEYIFKTSFMRRFSQAFSEPFMLRINRLQSVRTMN